LRQGDTVLLRDFLDRENDFLVLSRMTRAADPAVRGWALLRLSALEPTQVERHLAVHRHCLEVGDRHRALEALDVADALAGADRRVMWARLDFHRESPVEELAAIVAYYEQHFAGDPVLGMVRERCRRRMDALDRAPETPESGAPSTAAEPVVVLDPVQSAGKRGAAPAARPTPSRAR